MERGRPGVEEVVGVLGFAWDLFCFVLSLALLKGLLGLMFFNGFFSKSGFIIPLALLSTSQGRLVVCFSVVLKGTQTGR